MHANLKLIAILIAFLSVIDVAAQEIRPSLGVFNSPRGFGANMYLSDIHDNGFSSISIYADLYGVITGRCDEPGVKFNYSRNFNFLSFNLLGTPASLYAGPGLSLGYVKDYEPGFALSITKNHGFCAAVSGDIGLKMIFPRGIALDFSFMADFGVHLRQGEDVVSSKHLSLYKNGLTQAYWPNLSILFAL